MDLDETICKICYYRFDEGTHFPRLIPRCGHTFCQVCIEKILNQAISASQKGINCPMDKIFCPLPQLDMSHLPKNYSFFNALKLIEKNLVRGKCKVHNKEFFMICLDHRKKLCAQCYLEDHKGHDVADHEDLLVEANQNMQFLDSLKSKLNEIKQQKAKRVLQSIDEREKQLVTILDVNFKNLKKKIQDRENHLKREIQNVFKCLREEYLECGTLFDNQDESNNTSLTSLEREISDVYEFPFKLKITDLIKSFDEKLLSLERTEGDTDEKLGIKLQAVRLQFNPEITCFVEDLGKFTYPPIKNLIEEEIKSEDVPEVPRQKLSNTQREQCLNVLQKIKANQFSQSFANKSIVTIDSTAQYEIILGEIESDLNKFETPQQFINSVNKVLDDLTNNNPPDSSIYNKANYLKVYFSKLIEDCKFTKKVLLETEGSEEEFPSRRIPDSLIKYIQSYNEDKKYR